MVGAPLGEVEGELDGVVLGDADGNSWSDSVVEYTVNAFEPPQLPMHSLSQLAAFKIPCRAYVLSPQ